MFKSYHAALPRRMYVIIGGAGQVGQYVARSLVQQGHELAIIEADEASAEKISSIDALVVRGNAASPDRLEEAGVKKADVFVGVTNSDEVNLVGSALAHSYGARTIARINNPDYVDEPVSTSLERTLGVNIAVCPDLATSARVTRIFLTPTLLDTEVLAEGQVQLLESHIGASAPVAGVAIRDMNLPRYTNIVAIFRGKETIIPDGSEVIQAKDDVIAIMGAQEEVPVVAELFGYSPTVTRKEKAERIVIAGATRIGRAIAARLEKLMEVVLLDPSAQACRLASESLSSTLCIQGDPTDREVMVEEDLIEVDAFVGATPREDLNTLSCVMAKQNGARMTIAVVYQPELRLTLHEVGVDVAVSPTIATMNAILQHVHFKKGLASLYVLHHGNARVVEFAVTERSRIAGLTIGKAGLPRNSLVAAIVRNHHTIIPRGDDAIYPGDRLIMFARTNVIPRLAEAIL
ncbi:MAG: Trk system potassium transporter TrkA [Euryarchaeota archaeon]|nr:Trk system potassium transporter TrkA [Euryarchaeota archaeon]